MTAMQGIAAVLAGLLAQRVDGGPSAAIGIIGCASLVVSMALIPGLRRTKGQSSHDPAFQTVTSHATSMTANGEVPLEPSLESETFR